MAATTHPYLLVPRLTAAALLACLVAPHPVSGQEVGRDAWTGWAQCKVHVYASTGWLPPFPGEGVLTHTETHTWQITGTSSRPQDGTQVYDATWSVAGSGDWAAMRNNIGIGVPTPPNDHYIGNWAIAVSGFKAPLAVGVAASDRGLVISAKPHSKLAVADGGKGSQTFYQSTYPDPRLVLPLAFPVNEWPFPSIEDVGSSTRIRGSSSTPVNQSLGPSATDLIPNPPGGITGIGTADCTWDFAKGVQAGPPPGSPQPAQSSDVTFPDGRSFRRSPSGAAIATSSTPALSKTPPTQTAPATPGPTQGPTATIAQPAGAVPSITVPNTAAIAPPASATLSVLDGPWKGEAACVVSTKGKNYQEDVTHTWRLTGSPPEKLSGSRQWPAYWTVQGSGSGPNGRWTINVPGTSAPVAFIEVAGFRGANRLRITSTHGMLVAKGITTRDNTGREITNTIQEWPFPRIDEVPIATTPISDTRTRTLPYALAWQRPSDAVTTETCTWRFTR